MLIVGETVKLPEVESIFFANLSKNKTAVTTWVEKSGDQ